MSQQPFDHAFWERRWVQVLAEHRDAVAARPPNAHLVAAVDGLPPGRALDAGCGHGAEAIRLAAAGWQVSAVDFSATALAHARTVAESWGAEVAERIEWVEHDLETWTPPAGAFDLVSSLYVHVAGPVRQLVSRLGAGVAPGGARRGPVGRGRRRGASAPRGRGWLGRRRPGGPSPVTDGPPVHPDQ